MKVRAGIRVGAASHTGLVRSTNEDDYLLLEPEADARARQLGRLFVVADGMGGVAGGAEASRAAVRALGGVFMSDDESLDDGAARMRQGFAAACQRVYRLSREAPNLRGMGTTLTAMNLHGDRLVLGHVGDTRCLRLRRGRLESLTEDHALHKGESNLTRCIGGGRDTEEVDVGEFTVAAGDVYLLATDGLWNVVDPAVQREVLGKSDPQAAAEELVRRAVLAGGPDNCTAIVMRVIRTGGSMGAAAAVDLPAEEIRSAMLPAAGRASLRAARWPWVLLALSVVVSGVALARAFGLSVFGS